MESSRPSYDGLPYRVYSFLGGYIVGRYSDLRAAIAHADSVTSRMLVVHGGDIVYRNWQQAPKSDRV